MSESAKPPRPDSPLLINAICFFWREGWRKGGDGVLEVRVDLDPLLTIAECYPHGDNSPANKR